MSEPSMVYVVMGESGEYSDRFVWVESVWSSEQSAQFEVDRLATISRQAEIKNWARGGGHFGRNPQTIPLTDTDPRYFLEAGPLDAPKLAKSESQE